MNQQSLISLRYHLRTERGDGRGGGIKWGDDWLEVEKRQLIPVVSEAADDRLIVSQCAKDK